jgi:hypothetical protein
MTPLLTVSTTARQPSDRSRAHVSDREPFLAESSTCDTRHVHDKSRYYTDRPAGKPGIHRFARERIRPRFPRHAAPGRAAVVGASIPRITARQAPAIRRARHRRVVRREVPLHRFPHRGRRRAVACPAGPRHLSGRPWPGVARGRVCCPNARRPSAMDARVIEGIAGGCFSRQGVECHVTCLPRKLLLPDRVAPVTRRRRHRAGRLRTPTSWRPGHGARSPGARKKVRGTACSRAAQCSQVSQDVRRAE